MYKIGDRATIIATDTKKVANNKRRIKTHNNNAQKVAQHSISDSEVGFSPLLLRSFSSLIISFLQS